MRFVKIRKKTEQKTDFAHPKLDRDEWLKRRGITAVPFCHVQNQYKTRVQLKM